MSRIWDRMSAMLGSVYFEFLVRELELVRLLGGGGGGLKQADFYWMRRPKNQKLYAARL